MLAGIPSRRSIAERLHIDIPLLSGLLILSALGMVVLYSAGGQDMELMLRQSIRIGVAFAVMLGFAQIPPRLLAFWSPWLYAGGIFLLLAVWLFGEVGKGAQRWLDLGFMSFQPSEVMKLAVPMMIAWFIADKRLPPAMVGVFAAGLFIIVPSVLIARQPDLGTSLLVGIAGAFVLLLAGIRKRFIGGFALLCAASTPVLWMFMQDYQRRRVLTFLNPEADPLGAGYHIIQSKIAVGSGGLYGKGWLNGTQSNLEFVPERATDFIFAVLSEEFGLLGVILLLTVYLLIVWRGMYMAMSAQDTYARLLGGSLILTFFIYVFVNIGMVTGLLPVVGVPLPLFSYGGTAMVTLMASFGILMSMHTHRRLLSN